jgi:hypothetical protein
LIAAITGFLHSTIDQLISRARREWALRLAGLHLHGPWRGS